MFVVTFHPYSRIKK